MAPVRGWGWGLEAELAALHPGATYWYRRGGGLEGQGGRKVRRASEAAGSIARESWITSTVSMSLYVETRLKASQLVHLFYLACLLWVE